MEFTEVVRRRRMVRNYDPTRPVPPQTLDRVLGNAVRAPSAGFSQGWDFVVLTEEADREAFWAATSGPAATSDPATANGPAATSDPATATATDPQAPPDSWLTGLRNAPCLIICCSDKSTYLSRYAEPDKGWTDRDEAMWPVPYWDVDTGMAVLLMLLTAVDEGLGSLFFGVPVERLSAVRKAFSIPQGHNIVGVVALGHVAPDRRSPSLKRGRRHPEQVAHQGRFGRPWGDQSR